MRWPWRKPEERSAPERLRPVRVIFGQLPVTRMCKHCDGTGMVKPPRPPEYMFLTGEHDLRVGDVLEVDSDGTDRHATFVGYGNTGYDGELKRVLRVVRRVWDADLEPPEEEF